MKNQHLTTSQGSPVGDNQNSLTAGEFGPVLIQDVHLLEKLAHFNRERVPERVVHAKGAGAHGIFKVSQSMAQYTKADFLSEVGKETPLFARFSTVAGELGSSDTLRDPRGFALKFYTDEGNYDLVGNNTPIFFIRDAIKFPDFIHSQKRNPRTHLKSPEAVWDFWSHSPESLHQVTILMSDRGIPLSFRHMHGFGSHTFKWVNAAGEVFFVKYHFKTNQGIKNLESQLAEEIVEQVTFSPGNFVPGIEASPDKLLQGRLFAYGDAHRHRVGANSHQLPINQAKAPVNNYQKDGNMRFNNGNSEINYEPNSYTETPKEDPTAKISSFEVEGNVGNYSYNQDHFTQANALYNLLPSEEKENLINNIAASLGQVKNQEIIARQIDLFTRVNPEYGARVAQAIKQQA
ncbi:catalase [Enterococcus faecalis]|nr:catalase [Enterococcus faecalis]